MYLFYMRAYHDGTGGLTDPIPLTHYINHATVGK